MRHINKGIENRLYYFQLDKLKEKNIKDFVSINDNNNLYYIYKNNKQMKNLLDLYLYLVAENYEEIKDMEKQLDDKIYKGNNPFDNRYKYYIYYPYEYLYNYKYINVIPVIKEKYNIKYNFGDNFDIKLIRTQRNQSDEYDRKYYFAYGANILEKNLSKVLGIDIDKPKLGILHDYRLIFNAVTEKQDQSYANLSSSENDMVYGKIYQLYENDLQKLDKHEYIYTRFSFNIFNIEDNINILGYAYIIEDKKYINNNIKPTERYLNYYKESDLPKEYIKKILNPYQY